MNQGQTATPDAVRDVIRQAWARAQSRSLKRKQAPDGEQVTDSLLEKPAAARRSRDRKAQARKRRKDER